MTAHIAAYGRLVADPERRETRTGKPWGTARLAVTLPKPYFFCRQCWPDRNARADAKRRIPKAAGLACEREAAGGSRPAVAPGSVAVASICRRIERAEPPARTHRGTIGPRIGRREAGDRGGARSVAFYRRTKRFAPPARGPSAFDEG